MLEGIITAFLNTGLQLLAIFGVFFVFGWAIGRLNSLAQQNIQKYLGSRGLMATAWIGTPVHELGHLLLCFPFGHHVKDFQMFRWNPEDGKLGYVHHTYNPRNWWEQIGNLFIGAGPLIGGTLALWGLKELLIPGGISEISFFSWQFLVFLSLSVAIAAHMGLSRADMKGVARGGFFLTIVLLLLNLGLQLFDTELTIDTTWWLTFGLGQLMLWALGMASLYWLVSWLLHFFKSN